VNEKNSGWVPDLEDEEGCAEEDACGPFRYPEANWAKDMVGEGEKGDTPSAGWRGRIRQDA
jgi:hypothetical protein